MRTSYGLKLLNEKDVTVAIFYDLHYMGVCRSSVVKEEIVVPKKTTSPVEPCDVLHNRIKRRLSESEVWPEDDKVIKLQSISGEFLISQLKYNDIINERRRVFSRQGSY